MSDSHFWINKIKVENFKSFKNLELDVIKLNVVIGQNASGKSNFKQIFAFLKDILDRGLGDAIGFQGGSDYIQNLSSSQQTLSMEYHFTSDQPNQVHRLTARGDSSIPIFTNHIVYKFSIKFNKNLTYKITSDALNISCFFTAGQKSDLYEGNLIISKSGNEINVNPVFSPKAGSIVQKQLDFLKLSKLTKDQLLIESDSVTHIVDSWSNFLTNMGIYDFEPQQLKSPSVMRSPTDLMVDGSNLSYVLNKIPIKTNKILKNLVSDLLPFFQKIIIQRSSDGSINFDLKEDYSSKKIPSLFISDGTANIMALITAMYLQNNRFTIIEEPERNLHPGLLLSIVELMKDVSSENQMIITTHNLSILELIPIENLLLAIRTDDGNSTIIKPKDDEMIKKFVKVMGMKELMSRNLLK